MRHIRIDVHTWTGTHAHLFADIRTLMKRTEIFMVNWMHTQRELNANFKVHLLCLFDRFFVFAASALSLLRSLYLFIHFSASSISLMPTCVWVSIYTPTTDIHMNSENAFRDNCKRYSHLHTACIQLRASFINMCVRVWERVQKQRKRILCMDVNEFHVTLQLTVSERMCCVCISTLFLIYSRHLLTLRWTQVLMREFVTRLYAIKTIEWRWWWVDWWVVRVSVSV